MIKPISLKTKKDKWGNSVFSFAEIFPVYERTSSVSLREKALAEWKDFLSGERTQLTHKYLAVLAAIVPEEYSKFLDYVFSRDVLDEEIALILFRQLHPSWDKNPHFDQLLQLGRYIKTYRGNSSKIKLLQENHDLLFQVDAPQRVGSYFHNRLKEQWIGKPRTIQQLNVLETILQDLYREIYSEKLPEPKEIKKCIFPLLALGELFKSTEPELDLAENFTHDFIMNPKLVKERIATSVLPLVGEYLDERRKTLELSYIEQLYRRYISPLINMPCNKKYLDRLEEIACAIYKLYPIDYKTTNVLPDRNLVMQVLKKLIAGSWSSLSLCPNFMQDLRLVANYPQYGKLIGELITSNRSLWRNNNEGIKVLYLNQMLDSYVRSFASTKYDTEYLRKLENVENDFRTRYYSVSDRELYNEMAIRLLQGVIDNTWSHLQLCPCKAFLTDFRLRQNIPVKTPLLTTLFQKKIIDKVNVLIQYVFALEKEGFFEQLNDTADAFAKYVSSSYEQISQRNERAGRILLDYYNLQKIITTFTGNDEVAIERRDFWINMRQHVTDTFKVYQAADRLLFLASFKDKLVLDSTKYAEACYVFYNTSADFLSRHIQDRIRYSASNVSPVNIAKSLYGHRNEQIRHSSGWQGYLKYVLTSRHSRNR